MLHDDAVLSMTDGGCVSELVSAQLDRRQVPGGGLAAAAEFFAGSGFLGGVASGAPAGARLGARATSSGGGGTSCWTQPTVANEQMLAANPYVADALASRSSAASWKGMKACEVTGVISAPDERTILVNIQRPGGGGGSTWPHTDAFLTPRSSTLVVTKDAGGVVGT